MTIHGSQAATADSLDKALRANNLDEARRLFPVSWVSSEQLFVSYLERGYLSATDSNARALAARWAEVHFRIVEYDFARAVVVDLETADSSRRQGMIGIVRDYFAALEALRAASPAAPVSSAGTTPMVSSGSRDPQESAAIQRRNAARRLVLEQFLDVAGRFQAMGVLRGQYWTLRSTMNLDGWADAREKSANSLADRLGDELSLVLKRPYTEASLAMAERVGASLRQASILESLAGNLTSSPDPSRPADPAKLEPAARYLERARAIRRALPPLESVNYYLFPSAAPSSATTTLPQLWGLYHRLNRAAEASPLMAEAIEISRPFGEAAVQSTLSNFVLRAGQANLDWQAQQPLLDAARAFSPSMELWVARRLSGSGIGFRQTAAERALALAAALPDSRERAVTLEWYSRNRLEAEYQMIVNPGGYTPADVSVIEQHPFPGAFDQLLALCVKSDEVELTADALGHQALFQASTGHGTEALATFNQAVQHAERAGNLRKVAQLANRAAAPNPGEKVLAAYRAAFVERAVAAARTADDPLELAKGLRVRALNLSVGATNQSFEDLQQAAAAASRYTAESGDAAEEVTCLRALGNEYVLRGDYRAAAGVMERAAEKAKTVSSLASNPSILIRLARIYAKYLGESVRALEVAERTREFIMTSPAVRAARPPGSPNANAARANVDLAQLFREVGQPVAALDAYAKAVDSYAGSSDWLPNQRMLFADRAHFLTELGDYDAALADWDRVKELMPATLRNSYGGNEPVQRGVWAADVARVQFLAGNSDKALAAAREAIGQFDRDSLGVWVGLEHLNAIVDILLATRQPTEAIAFCDGYFKKVRERAPVADPVVERAYLEMVARAYREAAQFDRARALLLSAAEIDRTHPTAEVGGLAATLLALGRLEAEAGDFPKAKEHLLAARAAVNPYDRDWIWQIDRALAQVLLRLGEGASARARYADALASLEGARERLRPEEFRLKFGIDRMKSYEENASLMAAEAVRSGNDADAAAAFAAAERKRTQLLWGLLAAGWSRLEPTAVPDQVQRMMSLDTRIAAMWSGLAAQFSQPSGARNANVIEELRAELAKTQAEHAKLLSVIAQGQYRYAAPTVLADGLVRPVRSALGPSRTLVEYLVTDERCYAFVVSPVGVKVVPLAVGRTLLRQQVERLLGPFRKLRSGQVDLARLEYDLTAAHALYRLLFAPLRPLLGSVAEVVLVPDDVLNFLPFEALIEAPPPAAQPSAALHGEYAGQSFLLRRYAISYLPSAAELLPAAPSGAATKPAKRLFAMANPTAGLAAPVPAPPAAQDDPLKRQLRSAGFGAYLAPLPGAEAEVERIARTFPVNLSTIVVGANATEEAYKSQAGKHTILHFAAHAVASDAQPLYSTLVLAPDAEKKNDGFLQAYEVLRTPLQADLVVLSGCETARGAEDVGQGLVGLVAAFKQAGAKSVLATLWSIDETTSEAMDAFYRAMADGKTSPAALRQAKLQLLQQRVRMGKTEVSLAHPFFWAPFILVGAR